jgi:holo-[acyl-carrier protein] synthase
MIIGIGTDIVEVQRLQQAVERFGHRFIRRVFSENEIKYSEGKVNRFQHLAVRFGAKEALLKAMGTGLRGGILWHEIEVRNDELGKPKIFCHGKCLEKLNELGVKHIHVSLTHTEKYGIANVILEK